MTCVSYSINEDDIISGAARHLLYRHNVAVNNGVARRGARTSISIFRRDVVKPWRGARHLRHVFNYVNGSCWRTRWRTRVFQ